MLRSERLQTRRICMFSRGVAITLALNVLLIQFVIAEDTPSMLVAPKNWKRETIKLPPGFATNMTLKGTEHVRFAPGMFNAQSDSFFTYVFAFEIEKGTKLDEVVLKRELLAYYRGLSKAVLRDKAKGVDFSGFELKLKQLKTKQSDDSVTTMSGKLTWIEPFATKSQQTLNMEVQLWSLDDNEVLFVCVSPIAALDSQKKTPIIWQQMRQIRSRYHDRTRPTANAQSNSCVAE